MKRRAFIVAAASWGAAAARGWPVPPPFASCLARTPRIIHPGAGGHFLECFVFSNLESHLCWFAGTGIARPKQNAIAIGIAGSDAFRKTRLPVGESSQYVIRSLTAEIA